jgi:glyoxylase I family protein
MRLHHLAMRTGDLPRLLRFYSEVLGLPVIQRTPSSVWLDAGGVIVMLEARDDGESIPAGSKEMVAFGIRPEERRDWLTKLGGLIEAQTEFTLYFRDPDGRRVGLSHYPDGPTSVTPGE